LSRRADDQRILAGIAAVAREHLDFDGALRRDTPIVDALRLDSLRLLTLVVEIENHFRIALEEGSETGITTVGDLVDAIRSELEPDTEYTR
jgi:acyl carrier protein